MGQEISTIGGSIAVVATSVASGVCGGQVECLNNAVVASSKFTAKSFMNSGVRHVGETIGVGIATGATAVAAGVTLGQCEGVNNAVKACASRTATTGARSGVYLASTGNDVLDSIPGLAHAKGGIHYACGDIKGGDKAMKGGTRTLGVIGGGVVGIAGGPVGMVFGGIAGGSVADGAITGVESAINGEYVPSGQIETWTKVVTAKNGQERVGAIVAGVATTALDGIGGFRAGSAMKAKLDANADALRNVDANGSPELLMDWNADGAPPDVSPANWNVPKTGAQITGDFTADQAKGQLKQDPLDVAGAVGPAPSEGSDEET